ncbi:hypothetical protein BGZ76_005777 [Entomortierella beljakovae]|nr:hypothetical protein BGZ76_005777 [Entomortierella beljakovae]
MSQLERDLFGSSDSDSDLDSDPETSIANGRLETCEPGGGGLNYDTLALEDDPLFHDIMSSNEEGTERQNLVDQFDPNVKVYSPRHDQHSHIPGLCLHTHVLSNDDQARLMALITEKNFFKAGQQNQAMCFGKRDLKWLDWLEERMFMTGVLKQPYCDDQWTKRSPLFDQSIMNLYFPGDGIKPHVDLARFEDGIVVISLLSAINMDFYPALNPMKPDDPPSGNINTKSRAPREMSRDIIEESSSHQRVPSYTIRLEPGSIITIQGSARYEWEHGIQESMQDLVRGEECVKRKIRVSITLRKMRDSAWTVGNQSE